MTKDRIRVACLGAGYFGRFHYDAWRRLEDVELVGSADNDISKAERSGVPAFDNLGKMLADVEPDIVDIITPPPSHFEAISTTIEAGARAIICQKPFCETGEQAKLAVQLARDADIPLIIHENFRFQPWYRRIARAIAAGEIGDACQVTFRMRTGDGQGADAYLDRQPYFRTMERLLIRETGVHWIDTFRFLLGDPTAVYADLRRLNPVIKGEDAGYVIFDFPNNVRAVYDGNRHLDHDSENCRLTFGEALVEGTSGTLSLSGDGTVTLRRFGLTESQVILAPQDWPGFAGDSVYALQQHVVKGILDNREFENTAEDYLRVMEIEEAIYRSAELHRKLEV